MKRILIVDDNENNRMLLRAVLEEYASENNARFAIDEAINGVEAVALCEETHYHLVLMDIMMPEMDGIEATKRIRQRDPKVLIVAVSAVDDSARQKEILSNGAEDYITKPINIDIFNARLSNYLTLVVSRQRTLSQHEAHNLFSREIYCRKLSFFIQNEDDLAEFWEYYLLRTLEQVPCESLSDAVRTLYAVGSIALKFAIQPNIIIEDSNNHLYLTMEGLEELDPKFIRLVLSKTPGLRDYRLEADKLSIRMLHRQCDSEPVPQFTPQSTPVESVAEQPAAKSVFEMPKTEENRVYDYMDEEDLHEIKNYIGQLNSLLLVVGSGDIQTHEVEEISVYMDRIAKICLIYSESYSIGRALGELSEMIRAHEQLFIEKSSALGPMCAAFSRDLMTWLRLVFEEGAPSVNYMDDTIISNTQTIGSLLKMDDIAADEAVDLDDIFDF